jgi:hypothetical protein
MQTTRHPASDFDPKSEQLNRLARHPERQGRRPMPDRKSPDPSSATTDSGLLRELKETPRHLD